MIVIFGTHKLPEDSFRYVLYNFPYIDTATSYSNDKLIGEYKGSIITKFNPHDFEKDIVQVSNEHIKRLSSNIHTVLLHSPMKTSEEDIKALFQLKQLFQNSKVGVSNFEIRRIQYLIDNGCKPDVISIEFHPYYQPLKLVDFCKKNNIII